jgi:hypothetical protein
MTKIKVELNASFGCDCMGCGYGSEETIEIEVNEQELEALRKLGSEEISCEAVMEAIENGETALQSLHEYIEERFYYMVDEYWLYEADNECLEESLSEAIENDLSEDIFIPSLSVEEFIEAVKNKEIDFDGLQFGYFEDIEDNYDLEDEDDVQSLYNSYILNEYYDWLCDKDNDHAFVADRVGVDLDACHEDGVNYKIMLSE